MKAKLAIGLLTVVLATTGSTCLNEGFLVALNMAIGGCHAINPGPNLNFGGSEVIRLADLIDGAYRDKITGARYYDIRVLVKGSYSGSVAGSATLNGVPLLTYNGTWAQFSTPQSLLGTSPHITPQSSGINELVRVLNQFAQDPNTTLTLAASGTLSGQSPVPGGLEFCVEILAQADAQTN